jgi:hypothetical protein
MTYHHKVRDGTSQCFFLRIYLYHQVARMFDLTVSDNDTHMLFWPYWRTNTLQCDMRDKCTSGIHRYFQIPPSRMPIIYMFCISTVVNCVYVATSWCWPCWFRVGCYSFRVMLGSGPMNLHGANYQWFVFRACHTCTVIVPTLHDFWSFRWASAKQISPWRTM